MNNVLKQYLGPLKFKTVRELVLYLQEWNGGFPHSMDFYFVEDEIDEIKMEIVMQNYLIYVAEKKYRLSTGKVLNEVAGDHATYTGDFS